VGTAPLQLAPCGGLAAEPRDLLPLNPSSMNDSIAGVVARVDKLETRLSDTNVDISALEANWFNLLQRVEQLEGTQRSDQQQQHDARFIDRLKVVERWVEQYDAKAIERQCKDQRSDEPALTAAVNSVSMGKLQMRTGRTSSDASSNCYGLSAREFDRSVPREHAPGVLDRLETVEQWMEQCEANSFQRQISPESIAKGSQSSTQSFSWKRFGLGLFAKMDLYPSRLHVQEVEEAIFRMAKLRPRHSGIGVCVTIAVLCVTIVAVLAPGVVRFFHAIPTHSFSTDPSAEIDMSYEVDLPPFWVAAGAPGYHGDFGRLANVSVTSAVYERKTQGVYHDVPLTQEGCDLFKAIDTRSTDYGLSFFCPRGQTARIAGTPPERFKWLRVALSTCGGADHNCANNSELKEWFARGVWARFCFQRPAVVYDGDPVDKLRYTKSPNCFQWKLSLAERQSAALSMTYNVAKMNNRFLPIAPSNLVWTEPEFAEHFDLPPSMYWAGEVLVVMVHLRNPVQVHRVVYPTVESTMARIGGGWGAMFAAGGIIFIVAKSIFDAMRKR